MRANKGVQGDEGHETRTEQVEEKGSEVDNSSDVFLIQSRFIQNGGFHVLRKRPNYCFESTVQRRELTECCGKLGKFCEKLSEFLWDEKNSLSSCERELSEGQHFQ